MKFLLAITILIILTICSACVPSQADYDRAQQEQDKIDYPNGLPEGGRSGSMTGFGNH